MSVLINLLIDVLFYSMIDSIILYLFVKILFLDFKLDLKDILRNGLCISIIISICGCFVKTVGVSQIVMGLALGIYMCITRKKDFVKCIAFGLIATSIICIIEFTYGNMFNYLLDIKLFTMELNSIPRFVSYLIFKFLEMIIYIVGRKISMKLVLGGVVRK